MNKSDLIKKIASNAGITQTQAKAALQTIEVGIVEALVNGENVQLVGFGTFTIKSHKARKGRNPKTGEELNIPAKNVVKFKAGKGMNEAVN